MSTVTLPRIGSVVGDREAALYHYAVRCGEIGSLAAAAAELGLSEPSLREAAERLAELHLLRAEGGRWMPLDPEVATAMLVSPLERAMYQRREQADRLRDRIGAITRPPSGAPSGSIDGLSGVAEIRGLFKLAAEVCRDSLVVLRPAYSDEDLLDELLAPCYGVLERDVAVRVVCPHRTRADFGARARSKRLMEEGAQIRTLSQVPQAAVVFDDNLAVMLSLGGDEPSARRVRDRNVVQFLVEVFGQLWEGGTPFASDEPGYADAVDDLQQSIARLMAQGLTDEVVARRLGMSVRTCRRHIAALLQNLGSVSRFQAGVRLASRGALSGARGA